MSREIPDRVTRTRTITDSEYRTRAFNGANTRTRVINDSEYKEMHSLIVIQGQVNSLNANTR